MFYIETTFFYFLKYRLNICVIYAVSILKYVGVIERRET